MEIKKLKTELQSYSKTKQYYEKVAAEHKKTINEIKKLDSNLEDLSIKKLTAIFIDLLSSQEHCKELQKELKKYHTLSSCISLLDPIDQRMVYLHFFKGWPYWKVGQEIGYSEEGARKRINRTILPLLCEIIENRIKCSQFKMEDIIMALPYKNVYKLEDGKLIRNKENYIKYKDSKGNSRTKTNPTYDDFIKNGWYPLKHDETIPQYDPNTHTVIDVYVQEKDHIFCTCEIVEIKRYEEEQ